MKAGDLKWISVWCRRFTVDFGNLIFPDNLDLPTSEKQLPHPLVPVDNNDVSGEPEPEGESEPEPEHDHDHDHHHDHDHNRVDAEPGTEGEPSSSTSLVVSSMAVLLLTSLLL